MDDEQDFRDREARYKAHMERFRAAHAAMPETMRDVLVELERQERWPQIMGKYAAVLEAPL